MNAIEIAKNMEIDAINFYLQAAEKSNSPFGKQLFLSISEDEKRHLSMVESLLKGMNFTEEDTMPMDRIKTVFEELKDEMTERVAASSDDLEALTVAMKMEQEGFDFYKKTAAEASTDKERQLFERLAKEEDQHYKAFSNTHHFLEDTGHWMMYEEKGIVEGG